MENSKVNGGAEKPPIISVGSEYVYIRSNFEQVTETDEFGEERTYWQWDEEIVPINQYLRTREDIMKSIAIIIGKLMDEQDGVEPHEGEELKTIEDVIRKGRNTGRLTETQVPERYRDDSKQTIEV